MSARTSSPAALRLLAADGLLFVSPLLFAPAPASRNRRSVETVARTGGGALRSSDVRTLALVLTGAGLLFGASEIAVTAAANGLARTAAAVPLPVLWGAGGLIGGLVAARAGGGAPTGLEPAGLLAAVPASPLALAAAAGSVVTPGLALVVAGTMIAPTCATAYAMIAAAAAPTGTVTEAFAWITTAVAIGASVGAAAAGALADAAGPAHCFVPAGGAAAAVAALAALRADTVTPDVVVAPPARTNARGRRAPWSRSTANAAAVGSR